MFPAPLFAFEFLNWPMLGWLAAAAAPILIHLWSRRRYREVSWAAMEYLLAALRQSRRRMNLENLLLLLVRTLLIVLLVLAVAEPVVQRSGFASARGVRTHRVIVLDGSYSMAYRPGQKSRFDTAKEMAGRIVEESFEGDGFTLILMSRPTRVVVGTPAIESRSFLREIENLELPHTSADLADTLRAVEQVLENARREAPGLTREEVYFISDLGRVGWSLERLDAAAKEDFHKRSQRLAESATFVVLDVGQPDADNLAVTFLRSSQPFATPGQSLDAQATLKNFGRRAQKQTRVEWVVDGRSIKQEQVDLAAGQEAALAFSCRFDSAGDHQLEVRIAGDRLEIDNHRWLVVPVMPAVRVLCVDGRPASDGKRSAGMYLATALAPRGNESGRATVQPEVRPESSLSEIDLAPYDCVFLCNVPQFTANEARILEAYLKRGGNLVFFLGDQVQAERYNQELGGSRSGAPRLLPARVGEILGPKDRLDPLEYRHPIVAPFRGQEQAGLLTTFVQKYFKLILPANSKAQVALALAGGDPLIVEEPIHRGRVFLVATSADTAWTAFPVWPSFLPIVREILSYGMSGQFRLQNVLVGEPLGGSFSLSAGEVPIALQLPSARAENLRGRTESGTIAWRFDETTQSGVYTAQFGPPVSRAESFAVNVDTIESDLTTLPPQELRDDVWPGIRFVHETSWQNLETPPAVAIPRPSDWTKALLYAVVVLLLLETYLARRFGHYAS